VISRTIRNLPNASSISGRRSGGHFEASAAGSMLRNNRSSGARRAARAARLTVARAIQSNSTTRFCLYASLINASGVSRMDPAGPRIKAS
jgi:hypothetical protein